eukprot:TRINITY_DN10222_c0_g1_i1.p1 TRINITY_DN10222_c0_g1~~TRINITY_DN10222_c0_g1_i1.p1  ORF type:complete len:348 (+),score=119.40 TRINITY_DN10222_c0_g1_i1:132-1175(+)
MGLCGGKVVGEQDIKNQEITKQLTNDKKKQEREIKMLLLGAGESGKSTFAKQMKLIHMKGFNNEERQVFKSIIYDNVLSSAISLVKGANSLNIPISDEEAAEAILEHEDYAPDDLHKLAPIVKRIWSDQGIKRAFEKASSFQLLDSAAYYLDKLDKLIEEKYVPTDDDILRSRSKTTGIIETEFTVGKTIFRMTDVGGQRSERKKWMHCFQDVTAVIFCDAISSYDQKLDEDNVTNRMLESLRLFNQICNNKWFADTSIILFLNKKDIFEEKLKKIPLTVAFPEYTGANTLEAASHYIEKKFVDQNENKNKNVYPHVTCATDTANIKFVFNAVQDIILQEASNVMGF